MKPLNEILEGCNVIRVTGSGETIISSLHLDSREVKPGGLFAAVRGTQTDGHRFIHQAITRGAVAVLCEALPGPPEPGVTYVEVAQSMIALGIVAAAFYDHPSHRLKLIGITGTNGKTTTASLLFHLFGHLGSIPGLISTIDNRVGEEVIPSTHTTPDSIQLNQLLLKMADAGCSYCFMEVSSHAIDQHRIEGLKFAGGVFTNLTHDHLDYHGSFDEYLRVKKRFFDHLSDDAFALVNKDDKNAPVMIQNCGAEKFTYGLTSAADFRCKVLENNIDGLHLLIDGREAWFRLIGRFNGYNLLAAYATAVLLGQDKTTVLSHLSRQGPVAGRFNYLLSPGKVIAIVDYEHTPDALKKVLETINEILLGKGRLITVVGAGGNRDTAKRPVMAGIASRMSDILILTSDNPRNEEPESILGEMLQGVPEEHSRNMAVITDRKEAIRAACAMATPGDFILVAGKGHETYQEIRGVRTPFDDMSVLREAFGMNNS